MATRTISNTGGNYNATASWVEGIVPTSADDIAATATSGQLTINVAAAARNVNLTNYNNTITFNANWTVSGGTGFTNTISSTTNFAGTVGVWTFTGVGSTQTMNTTNRIPNLNFSTNKTITTDWFCVNFNGISGSPGMTITGAFTIDISGNLGLQSAVLITNDITGTRGDAVFKLTGNGWIAFAHGGGTGRVEMDTTGTYSTTSQGLILTRNLNTPEFRCVSGNLDPAFRITLSGDANFASPFNINLAGGKVFDSLILTSSFLNSSGAIKTVSLDPVNGLNCRNLMAVSQNRNFTTDDAVPTWRFRGGSLSASNVGLIPAFRSNSTTANVTYNYLAPNIALDSGFTHSFGSIAAIGMLQTGSVNTRPTISSITASTTVNVNLISKTASQIINYNFTDVNAVGEQIVAINGTLLRTTNVTNTYPTSGGGVAGGSFTFVN